MLRCYYNNTMVRSEPKFANTYLYLLFLSIYTFNYIRIYI